MIGDSRILNTERFQYSLWPVLAIVDDPTYLRYRYEPATGTADIEFRVTRPEVVAEMALEKGARYDKGSHHVVIANVLRHSEGCTVILRESFVNLLFGEKSRDSAQYVLRAQNRNARGSFGFKPKSMLSTSLPAASDPATPIKAPTAVGAVDYRIISLICSTCVSLHTWEHSDQRFPRLASLSPASQL